MLRFYNTLHVYIIMPYIIIVFLLVVIGVGFTFVQQRNIEFTTNIPTTEIPKQENPVRDASTQPSPAQPQPEKVLTDEVTTGEPVIAKEVSPTPERTVPAPVVAESNNEYKDGTYSAQSTYRTPDGTYTMDVVVRLNDDAIASTEVTFDAKGMESGYSKRFLGSYQSLVSGKDIGDINLSRVGGSSLTTKAFNTALSAIKSQAVL